MPSPQRTKHERQSDEFQLSQVRLRNRIFPYLDPMREGGTALQLPYDRAKRVIGRARRRDGGDGDPVPRHRRRYGGGDRGGGRALGASEVAESSCNASRPPKRLRYKAAAVLKCRTKYQMHLSKCLAKVSDMDRVEAPCPLKLDHDNEASVRGDGLPPH